MPQTAVRSMIRARYVTPRRGPRGALRFSFQDLVLLRTARELLAARVSARRIGAALRAIRAKLPASIPPRGLSIAAIGDRIIVHEAGDQRDAHSGQLLLALEVHDDGGKLRLIDASAHHGTTPAPGADDCESRFEAALALEDTDVDAAVQAYQVCVARHAHRGAAANLGRLLHLQGQITEAVALYRSVAAPDVDILYNLGVALEDLGRIAEAVEAYVQALALDDAHADAHHNIARLYQQSGDARRALRHWNAYRRLARMTGRGADDEIDSR